MEPFPCDLCSSKASVYFTQIIDGKMQKVNLCSKCAKEKGVTDPTGFALADLLFGIGQQQGHATAPGKRPDQCPVCGLTAQQLKKTGRVGCAHCYSVFADSLGEILRAMQKGPHHTGKVPGRHAEQRSRNLKLNALRTDLDKAVIEERFEDAARFRDAILSMEKPATPAPLAGVTVDARSPSLP